MIKYSVHLIAAQPALTIPFSFPAQQLLPNTITGTNSEWMKLQISVKTDTTMNVGNMVEAWYAGLPFWGVSLPTTVS